MLETSFLLSFIGFFVILTPLVFVHEFGHYYAAIKSGVKVETFSIGFGPELFGFNDKKDTRWKFSLIPLGGYVKMKGELFNSLDNSNNTSLTKDTFTEASLLSRFIIVASGPIANLIFGSFLITSLYAFNGKYVSTSIIDTVIDSKPAKVAGILPGDKIISINYHNLLYLCLMLLWHLLYAKYKVTISSMISKFSKSFFFFLKSDI